MGQFTSEFSVLNQYFSNLAESFELTCKQLKLLNEEKSRIYELKKIEEEIRAVNILIRIKKLKQDSIVSSRFTIEELESMKSNFNEQLEDYILEENRIQLEYCFWKQRYNSQVGELTNIIIRLKNNSQALVITNESEVKILLTVYKEKSKLENCRVINCEEKALKYFPEGSLPQKFLKAYYDCNVEAVQSLVKENVDY